MLVTGAVLAPVGGPVSNRTNNDSRRPHWRRKLKRSRQPLLSLQSHEVRRRKVVRTPAVSCVVVSTCGVVGVSRSGNLWMKENRIDGSV